MIRQQNQAAKNQAVKTQVHRKKTGMVKTKPFKPERAVGDMINKPIDKAKNKIVKEGSDLVKHGAKHLKKAGVGEELVNWGSKKLIKHGSEFVNKAAGKTKKWIHTEGKALAEKGINKVKEGASNLGKRAREKIGEIGNKLKRRKT